MQDLPENAKNQLLPHTRVNDPHHVAMQVRGGRMTKVAGVAASYAPMIGKFRSGISAIALGAALTVSGADGAMAGDCTGAGGVYACSDPANTATDTTQALYGAGGLTVTTNPGFGIDTSVSGGDAFTLGSGPGGNLSFNDQNMSVITGNGDGIDATTAPGASSLSITTTGSVEGGQNGILATHYGMNSLTIMSTNPSGTASVTGSYDGVGAFNYNGGALNVTVDNATGGVGYDGMLLYNDVSGTSISVTTSGAVVGGDDGLDVLNYGTGGLTVSSTNDMGTASVTGTDFGILVSNYNGGDLSVTANNVAGTNASGIRAFNGPTAGNLSVTTSGDVVGGFVGIFTYNYGTGNTAINATNDSGTASATGYGGIVGLHYNGGSLSIKADNATATLDGVYSYTGATTTTTNIMTYGAVTSGTFGIRSYHNGTGDLSISSTNDMGTATVTGGYDGVNANNYNGGSVNITVDNVTGTTNDGIAVFNDPLGMNISVTTSGNVTGGDEGIDAINAGTGNLTIMSTNTTGTASVTGFDKGIDASNYNGGALSVTLDNATATNEEDAIFTYNDALGTSSTITVNGNATGADNGIYSNHLGTGNLVISVSGTTRGVTGSGISTYTGLGGMTRINVNTGANVSGGTNAILNGPGDSDVFFNDGSTVSGITTLGNGSDNLTIRNADISGATQLNGGDDTSPADGFIDVLTFDGFTGAINASLLNWEQAVFNGSTASFASNTLAVPMLALQNDSTFSPTMPGFTLNGDLTIDNSSRLNIGFGGLGTTVFNGNVANNGTISLTDGTAGDQVTVNGNLTGNGTVSLDVNVSTSTADSVQVNGNTSGAGAVSVTIEGSTTTPSDVPLINVTGTSSAGDFSLADPQVVTTNGDSAVVAGAFAYTLEHAPGSGSFFLSPFDTNGNRQLNPVAFISEAYPGLLTSLNQLSPTLQKWRNKRSGSNDADVGRALLEYAPTAENAIWMSLSGNQTFYEGQSTTGSEVDIGYVELEMGMDFPIFEGANGRMIGGFSFSHQDAGADVTSGAVTGSLNTKGSAIALNGLWLSDSRFYTSGTLKFSQFNTDMALSGVGAIGTNQSADGYSFSLEAGKAFDYSDNVTLVPQVQVVHSSVSGTVPNPFGGGTFASISDGETTYARIGLHAERSNTAGSIFGGVSLIHAFDDETTTTLAGVPFTNDPDDQRLEISAGGERNIGENGIIYGRLIAAGGLGGFGDNYSLGVSMGLRVRF